MKVSQNLMVRKGFEIMESFPNQILNREFLIEDNELDEQHFVQRDPELAFEHVAVSTVEPEELCQILF
jgi:hypothetical protein